MTGLMILPNVTVAMVLGMFSRGGIVGERGEGHSRGNSSSWFQGESLLTVLSVTCHIRLLTHHIQTTHMATHELLA